MGPAVKTALGMVVGLCAFLAAALMGVIAVNGNDNPGVNWGRVSAAGGASTFALRDSSHASLDFNGDGKVSLSEAAGWSDLVLRFERADRDKDGKLTEAEFRRLEKLPPPKARPKPKPQVRRDAAAALAAQREGQ